MYKMRILVPAVRLYHKVGAKGNASICKASDNPRRRPVIFYSETMVCTFSVDAARRNGRRYSGIPFQSRRPGGKSHVAGWRAYRKRAREADISLNPLSASPVVFRQMSD